MDNYRVRQKEYDSQVAKQQFQSQPAPLSTSYMNELAKRVEEYRHSKQPEPHQHEQGHEKEIGTEATEYISHSDEPKHEHSSFFKNPRQFFMEHIPKSVRDYFHVLFELERVSVDDIGDPLLHPEVRQKAHVRRGNKLCAAEAEFLRKRLQHVRKAFAKYIDVSEEEVSEEDLPVIAFGGSGGGYRAMITSAAYLMAMKKSGLLDLCSYLSGVSGSTWALACYYTVAEGDPVELIEHIKRRCHLHPAAPAALFEVLLTQGAAQLMLGGLEVKKLLNVPVVSMDMYGALIGGRLMLTRQKRLIPSHWKLSNQRKLFEDGSHPLPIYTAVRHERPWKYWVDPHAPFGVGQPANRKEEMEAEDAWFQWFEFTPYEIGCDELQAWIPTWGWGRHFVQGESTELLPEQDIGAMMGAWGSAPAAPLSAYIGTLQRNLPEGFFGNILRKVADEVAEAWGEDGVEIFESHHPITPPSNPNPLFQIDPPPNPPGIYTTQLIQLLDAGFDNNLPLYPMTHPARPVDVVLAVDASSDVECGDFLERYVSFSTRKGIKWTKLDEHGNPILDIPQNTTTSHTAESKSESTEAQAGAQHDPDYWDIRPVFDRTPDMVARRFTGRYCEVYYGQAINPPLRGNTPNLGEHNVPQATNDFHLLYMALYPNKVDSTFDPCKAPFCSTYNLVWTPEQIDQLVRTAVANFTEGEARIKQVLKDVWTKKKEARLRKV
ncbi:uncharacterized protein VTP21DRAFT_7711 [Calcarisporiella thermophila]|uniref:uncharacterized protein n=1 Tax=Calcarisporiella thermophila TaxID=911321 RepID=UPI003743E6D1